MSKIAYYPGCSGQGTSVEYDRSTRAVCQALGVELVDVPDWSCCGSTPAHTVNHVLSAALSARNLAQVESLGLDKVGTPCPSCLTNLRTAAHNVFHKQSGKQYTEHRQAEIPEIDGVLSKPI